MTPLARRFTLIAAVALILGAAAPAGASSEREVGYAYEQVFPAAVRFLRIDAGLTIVEKDAEAGYVLFDLAEDGRVFRGALELVRIRDDDGHPGVRLVIRVADRPTYTETGLLNRLVYKLQREIRESPPAPEPPAKGKGD